MNPQKKTDRIHKIEFHKRGGLGNLPFFSFYTKARFTETGLYGILKIENASHFQIFESLSCFKKEEFSMRKKRILALLSAAAALCVALAACSGGSTAQINTLPEKETAGTAQTAVCTSVELADKEIPVKAITSEQADVLCGIPAGTTPETPIRDRKSVV